jgi:hypothetical protein
MAFPRSLPAVLSFLLLSPAVASAEPIVIAGGTATTNLPAQTSSGDFNLITTDGRAIIVHWPDFTLFTSSSSACGECAPGTVVSPAGRVFPTGVPFPGLPTSAPSGSVGGVTMRFDGNLAFIGPATALPSVAPPETDVFTVNLPFVFGGLLNGYALFGNPPALVFSGELNGAGTASLEFSGTPFGKFRYLRTTYNFEPTPEPATMTTVLLAGGLAALYRQRRKGGRNRLS